MRNRHIEHAIASEKIGAATLGATAVASILIEAIGGAVVGSSVGVLVASIHSSPVHVVPVLEHRPEGNAAGLASTGSR